jgi:hypothetical protein
VWGGGHFASTKNKMSPSFTPPPPHSKVVQNPTRVGGFFSKFFKFLRDAFLNTFLKIFAIQKIFKNSL